MHHEFAFTRRARTAREVSVNRSELISEFSTLSEASRALDHGRLLRAKIRALSRELESMLSIEELLAA